MATSNVTTSDKPAASPQLSLYVVVGVMLLLVGTAVLVFFAAYTSRLRYDSTVTDLLIILAGMFAVGTLMSLQQLVGGKQRQEHQAPLTFDSLLVVQSLEDAQHELRLGVWPSTSENVSQYAGNHKHDLDWEPTPRQLVGVDPILALAKLRLDLERELRRIANETQMEVSLRPVSITQLSRELIERHSLPAAYGSAFEEITAVANGAIHGRDVPIDTAVEVISVGGQLVEQLRSLPRQKDL